jgi:hypothetical protein
MAAYKSMGITVKEVPGWRDRGIWRIASKGWEPHGVIIHQTSGNLGSRTVSQYIDDIINGDPAVPDKANAVIDPDGDLWINAAGRANHCLEYSQRAMDAFLNDEWPLSGKYHDLRGDLQNFNKFCYGVECIGTALNTKQIETAARWAAAICKAHGWTAQSVAGHGEVADDRDYSDPGVDMGAFRRRVDALLNPPPPDDSEELTVSQYTDIMSKLAWLEKVMAETQRRVTDAKATGEWTQAIVTENQRRINQTRTDLADLAATITPAPTTEESK